jgi:flagellar protein FliT
MDRNALSYYEAVAAASAAMLRAARDSDWDALLEHEGACARQVEALRRADAQSRLSDRELERKAVIIRQVLADDAEIRRLTQPWLRKLEELLRSSANQQRLDDAYR